MPIYQEFAPAGTYAIIHLSGRVTAEDVLGNMAEFSAHPSYRPGMPELVIIEKVEAIDLDFRTMLGVSSRMLTVYAQQAPVTQMAIFAPSDLCYGMARMFKAAADMGSAIDVGVFRDRYEALNWLFDTAVFGDETPTSSG
jgi:hypothetical protein